MTNDPIGDAKAAAERGDFESAIAVLRPLAAAGNREAQDELGFLALTECDLISGREAFALFLKAAEQGHAGAMYHLATFPGFHQRAVQVRSVGGRKPGSGCGGPPRRLCSGAARRWRVARDGRRREGKVPQDLPAAVAWYRRAAEAGHADAQYNLASMLAEGEGCERDLTAAREWLRRAIAGGYEYAEGLVAHLDALEDNATSPRFDVHTQIGHDRAHIGFKAGSRRSRRKSLADALFTKTQQRVLGVLFGQPERSFYASELIRDAGTGSGAAQRELARLEGSGLIVARRIGHQKHYQANAASPLYSELRNIVLKTVGLAEPLRDALKPLSSAIRAAFVYGSVAKATDQSASDIDLMIISDSLTYGEVFGALERVTRTVGRKVNPTVYTAAEFSKRARTENAFVTRVLEQPKLWVIGSER